MSQSSAQPLIIGSGIAGLYVALRLTEMGARPTVVTKSRLDESNTRYAQGGIAAAIGEDDSVALHLRDTVVAGDGLVNREAARILTDEAPRRIADLVRMGVPFDTIDGRVALGREAAHSRDRILHAGGDATGLAIEEALRARAVQVGVDAHERRVLRGMTTRAGDFPTVLLTDDRGRDTAEISGRPVVLATGGAGSLYLHSSNPSIATGEGVAIALRAGALVTDLEFIQFHPTAFQQPGAPHYLITEALRGEGAVLLRPDGTRFMPTYHRQAELAPRDVVSRAIHSEMTRHKLDHVLLDATAISRDRLWTRFPTICRFLEQHYLDPSRDPIPVSPAAHYLIGGVTTDLFGRSSLRGVWACGEVAATGVHGANRLASNSLLEGLVFGERVARDVRNPRPGGPNPPGTMAVVKPYGSQRATRGPRALDEVRRILWESVGIVREKRGLERAIRSLAALGNGLAPNKPPASPEENAVLTAQMIATAALAREESRGAHYRSDFPRKNRKWAIHLGLRLGAKPER